MKISQAFPSTFLRCGDLDGRDFVLTIDQVKMELVGNDQKPVLYFLNAIKGLVLNKTNTSTITSLYGDETTAWHNQRIVAYPTTTEYQGQRVDCIRLKAAPAPAPANDQLADANSALDQASQQSVPPLMRREPDVSDLDF